ncbi:MAG: aminoacetone oxidase family FAD-binding enzyme [Gemmatimonadetes bacterium]|nr:aminoacetone oxidase family FAD-binding enzyme [Gemmatimonadota bacterium]MDA1103906.1 aminoacetone oxidase family FAD-binding enzyme [Gemmatimonadota bacterium]
MTPDTESLPVAVIGAGAAGLMAALCAARAGSEVILLESTADGGRKILISGGGRCNVLPSVAQPERYVTDSSPNTLRNILHSWPLEEQRAFFEQELSLPLVLEEESGKLFPASQKARDVRDGLVSAVRAAGAKIWFGAQVTDVSPAPDHGPESPRWTIDIAGALPLQARAVIVATGGLSVPATGSDGRGLQIVEALGHTLNPTYPALTPLTADPHPHADLAGISKPVTIFAPGTKPPFLTTGGFLITHRGWSGPSVLDASHLAIRGRPAGTRQELLVAWTDTSPDDWHEILQSPQGTVRSSITEHLPRRLVDGLLAEIDVDGATPLSQLRKEHRRAVVQVLTEYRLPWTGDEGYKKAEVTGGGVALSEIDSRTMESRRASGLFLCGEILDAFGPIGGHNFLWAWATGRAAGRGV